MTKVWSILTYKKGISKPVRLTNLNLPFFYEQIKLSFGCKVTSTKNKLMDTLMNIITDSLTTNGHKLGHGTP